MDIANVPKNAKYIGYECVECNNKIAEDERQKIIALGCVQTWCMLCIAKKYPDDKHLHSYIVSNAGDTTILDRNKLLNNE